MCRWVESHKTPGWDWAWRAGLREADLIPNELKQCDWEAAGMHPFMCMCLCAYALAASITLLLNYFYDYTRSIQQREVQQEQQLLEWGSGDGFKWSFERRCKICVQIVSSPGARNNASVRNGEAFNYEVMK